MDALALTVILFAKGFDRPVSLKFDPAGTACVVEQKGRVVTAKDGRPDKVLLDVSGKSTRVRGYSEQGLLDIAFHPDYKKNGRLFAHYTDRKGDTVVSEFACREGACDAKSEKVLFTHHQPYSNHNGGQLEFGPDGALFLGLGDGGSAGDPHGNGQKRDSYLGKILRFDLARSTRPSVWALGLRNPWRFSFDDGSIYIADVGQNRWEEIDVAATDREGQLVPPNFGWNIMEGEECFRSKDCDRKGLIPPVLVYSHDEGDCSVTGGYVFRGHYFYSDYCTGNLWSFRYAAGKAVDRRSWNELNPQKALWGQVSSFGRDPGGNLYLVGYDRGAIVKFEPK